ncbi:MAG: hypothetical protein V4498_03255 [candidate division FCPU426 bacterium]
MEPALWFILGASLQVLLCLNFQWAGNRRRLLIILALCSIFFLSGRPALEHLGITALWFVGVFSVFFSIGFRDRLMPVVNEQTLLYFSLLFWYALMASYGVAWPIAWLFVVPSVGVAVACFTDWNPGRAWRYAFYFWFSFVMVFLSWICFSFEHAAELLLSGDLGAEGRIQLILLGMGLVFFIVGAMILLSLMPGDIGPVRRERPGGRVGFWKVRPQWKADFRLVERRYLREQVSFPVALAILFGEGGALLLNYGNHWLPVSQMIAVTAVFVPAMFGLASQWKKIR